MSGEQFIREPQKNRIPAILGYVAVAVVMFGAGMLLESRRAAQAAAAVKTAHEQELKQVEDKAEEQKRLMADSLTKQGEELAKEREEHEKTIQAKDKSMAAA